MIFTIIVRCYVHFVIVSCVFVDEVTAKTPGVFNPDVNLHLIVRTLEIGPGVKIGVLVCLLFIFHCISDV